MIIIKEMLSINFMYNYVELNIDIYLKSIFSVQLFLYYQTHVMSFQFIMILLLLSLGENLIAFNNTL